MAFFSNLWGTITSGENLFAAQAKSDQLDQQLYDFNQKNLDEEEWAAYQSHIQGSQADGNTYHMDVGDQVNDAFVEGAKEGAANLASGIKKGFNAAGGFVWKAIPWWVWLAAVFALFVWLGGLTLLKGRLAKT